MTSEIQNKIQEFTTVDPLAFDIAFAEATEIIYRRIFSPDLDVDEDILEERMNCIEKEFLNNLRVKHAQSDDQ